MGSNQCLFLAASLFLFFACSEPVSEETAGQESTAQAESPATATEQELERRHQEELERLHEIIAEQEAELERERERIRQQDRKRVDREAQTRPRYSPETNPPPSDAPAQEEASIPTEGRVEGGNEASREAIQRQAEILRAQAARIRAQMQRSSDWLASATEGGHLDAEQAATMQAELNRKEREVARLEEQAFQLEQKLLATR